MLNALLAVVLGVLALGLLAYIGALFLGALGGPLGGYLERRRFEQRVARAKRIDDLLQRGQVDDALALVLGSFYLSSLRSSGLAGAVANHHTGLLSRLITLTSEAQGGSVRLLSLAKTDRLLAERATLQKRYAAVAQGAPAERRRAVRQQLEVNRRALQAALEQLVEEVRTARQDSPRYH